MSATSSETRYRCNATRRRQDLSGFPLRGRVDLVRSGRAFTRKTVTQVTSHHAENLFLTFQFFRKSCNSTRCTHGLRVKVVLVAGPLLSASSVSQTLTARRSLPYSKSSCRRSASIANLNINSLPMQSSPVYNFRVSSALHVNLIFIFLIVEQIIA